MLFLYLHLVSALAFISLYFSFTIAAGMVAEISTTWFDAESMIYSLAFALVSAGLWWLHWSWIRRMGEFEESAARMAHKLYLVGLSVWMAFSLLISGSTSLNAFVRLLTGGGYKPETNGPALFSNLLILAFSILMWRLHLRRLRALSNQDDVAHMDGATA